MTNTCKASGFEALAILADNKLGDDPAGIIQHNAAIDIDNGGRRFDRQRHMDYAHTLWEVLLYVAEVPKMGQGWTIDDLFSVEYVAERNGCTTSRVTWFHINTDILDSESRGIHFEFSYAGYEPTPPVTYEVCDVCAQALTNGDTSSDDLDVERFDAFVADHGQMVRTTENRRDGYWDCEVCLQTQIGSGHLFEAVS